MSSDREKIPGLTQDERAWALLHYVNKTYGGHFTINLGHGAPAHAAQADARELIMFLDDLEWWQMARHYRHYAHCPSVVQDALEALEARKRKATGAG